MKREDFIKAIEARGFAEEKKSPMLYTKKHSRATATNSRASITSMQGGFHCIPYSAITEDLITAVAGPERSEE